MIDKLRDFFKTKLIQPILSQLKQGTTPEKLALSCALGLSLTVFPLLGTTVAISVAVGAILRLNIPAMLAVNYLLTPVQLVVIPACIYAGEALFGLNHITYNPAHITRELFDAPIGFLSRYGVSALAGILVWCMFAPALTYLVYKALLPILRKRATHK